MSKRLRPAGSAPAGATHLTNVECSASSCAQSKTGMVCADKITTVAYAGQSLNTAEQCLLTCRQEEAAAKEGHSQRPRKTCLQYTRFQHVHHSVPARAPLGARESCALMMKDSDTTRLRQNKGKTTADREPGDLEALTTTKPEVSPTQPQALTAQPAA